MDIEHCPQHKLLCSKMSQRAKLAEHFFNSSKEIEDRSVSQFIAHFLKLVRLIGCYPITITEKPNSKVKVYHFQFKLLSFATAFTFISNFQALYVLINFTIKLITGNIVQDMLDEYYLVMSADSVRDKGLSSNITKFSYDQFDQITKFCLFLVIFTVPVTGLYYSYSSLTSIPSLIKFLNGAGEFDNRIKEIFPSTVVDISVANLQHFRIKTMIGNSIIFICLVSMQITPVIRIATRLNILESKLFAEFFLLSSVGLVGIIDDTKVLVVLKVVEEYFAQITDGISLYNEERSRNNINIQTVKRWRSIIHFARKQAKIALASIQDTSIITLISLYIVLTVALYIINSAVYKDLPEFFWRYALAAFLFCVTLYIRLYAKASLAENITKKENDLAEVIRLIEIDSPSDTKFTKAVAERKMNAVEISFITDPLKAKPTECYLGGVVALKVSLLLGLFRNVSTYAVALIQIDAAQMNFNSTISTIINSTVIE